MKTFSKCYHSILKKKRYDNASRVYNANRVYNSSRVYNVLKTF